VEDCFKQEKDIQDNTPLEHKQYLKHYAPMIMKGGCSGSAASRIQKAGFMPESIHPIARSAIECACCEVCFLFYGFEPEKTEPRFDNTICTSVTFATEFITGYASRTSAAIPKDRERKLRKLKTGPAQLVLI